MKRFVADIGKADYARMRALVPALPETYDSFCIERDHRRGGLGSAGRTIQAIHREKIIPEFFARYAKARGIKVPTWDDLDRAALLQWQIEFPEPHRNSARWSARF
jgi:hypothetical protein